MTGSQRRRSSIVSKSGMTRTAMVGSSPGRMTPASRMISMTSSRSEAEAAFEMM